MKNNNPRLIPGLVSITFRAETPARIVEACRSCGLVAIEWGGDVHVPHGDLARAREVGEATRNAGLRVAAYGSYYRFDEATGEAAVLDTAVALGAPVLRVWAGSHGSAQTPPAERARIVAAARKLGERARARGLTVAFEYHRNTLTDTTESARSLLEEIDHPAVGTLWQPPVGWSADACERSLRAILDHLAHIHCFTWGPGGSTDRHPLAEGADAWLRYLRIAASHAASPGRELPVLLEFVPEDRLEVLTREAETLRHWLSRVSSEPSSRST
jgi:sugar phosphate isomerase/epimerase